MSEKQLWGAIKEIRSEIEAIRLNILDRGNKKDALRQYVPWSKFEEEKLLSDFLEFCNDKALKSGRNSYEIIETIMKL